jgi:glycerophosphoryl diester phosphodiesterase
MAAFRLAERMGVGEVELDVQFSKDRKIVICHDRILSRFGYPDLCVPELMLDELLALDMGSWFSPYLYGGERMLDLEALLSVFRNRFVYHVEIKSPEKELSEAVIDALSAHRLRDRAILTSFDFDVLDEVRALAPELRVGWLLREGEWTLQNIERAAAAGFYQICPPAIGVNREIVATAHRRVPEVRAHSVTGMAEMTKAVEAGCDGVTINWPDWLIHEGTEKK